MAKSVLKEHLIGWRAGVHVGFAIPGDHSQKLKDCLLPLFETWIYDRYVRRWA